MMEYLIDCKVIEPGSYYLYLGIKVYIEDGDIWIGMYCLYMKESIL